MNNTVVAVTNIPRPYRQALFDTVQARLASENLTLRVVYTSDPSKHVRRGALVMPLPHSPSEAYVRGVTLRLGFEQTLSVPTCLGETLTRLEPACVVMGGFGPSTILASRWCRKAKIPYSVWSGGWPGGEGHIGWLQGGLRAHLVRHASAAIAYGTAAAEYLVSVGALPDQVFCAWNTVDLEKIALSAREAASRREKLTPKFGLACANLLFVGSLGLRKGLRELISAALAAESPDGDWVLHLAGSGPLKKELQATIASAGREANFRFHGLLAPGDVAELLGSVDGLLLPTKREVWGLVINEAMACGVPVVASPWAGATRDLIQNEVTGYVVEPTDIKALARIISRLLSRDPECVAVGCAGAEAVRAKASLDRAADGFVAATRHAIDSPRA
jgi:glycosyltransferase involved in cell wall biosynthesis